jgi:tetratricopeptide (TPR) repeat protein
MRALFGLETGSIWAPLFLAALTFLPPSPCSADWSAKSEKTLAREADDWVKSKPAQLQQFLHTLYMEGEWNSVLNFNLLALAAMELGQHELAELALDQSTARIVRVYSNDANAEKARSLWSAEEVKDFKGEPYERSMAFLYRGLLYLREGDFQNARATFLQADLQNALGQTEKYDRSFALPIYLAAWASACDGDTTRAEDLQAQAFKVGADPYFKQAGKTWPRHLTLMARGIGPEKVTLGDTKSILSFLPQPDARGEFVAMYEPALKPSVSAVAGNLDWLALTRGGRPIQGILDGKASFKQTTGSIAEAGTQVASALYQSLGQLGPDKLSVAKSMASLGVGAQLLGSVAGLASRRTNAEADTRYWGSLPKYIQLEAVQDESPVSVKSFRSSHDRKPRPVVLSLADPKLRCSFAFGQEFSTLDGLHGGIGNPSPWPAEPREDNRSKINEGFREFLRARL